MEENTEGGGKEFAAYLKSTRSVEELTSGKYVTIRGSVHQSGESAFVVALEGQLLEIPASAVERFKVTGDGVHPEVELFVNAEALKTSKVISGKSAFSDGTQTLFAADQKSAAKDTYTDPISDHKPVFKEVHTDPIADQTLFVLDHKAIHKDPITDPVGTLVFDQLGNTAAESAIEGGGIDHGQVINPAAQRAAGGMTPFVMATPHHAPSAMVDLQMAAAQAPGAAQFKRAGIDTLKEAAFDNTIKEVIAETHKETTGDTLKELITDTHKETVLDTLKEATADTRKEVFETLVEGGGTFQEGGGTAVEGGGFPGGGFPGGFSGGGF